MEYHTEVSFFSKNFSLDMHMRYEGTYFSFAAVDNDETVCFVGQSCRSGCRK